MLPYILQGLTLGFAAGAQPGPFQTYLISQTLSQGWRRAWILSFAPLLSDGPIVALILLILSQVPDWFQRVLQIVGGLFVLYMAWGAFKTWKAFSPDTDSAPQNGSQNLLRAAMMNVLNPNPYIFWSTVIGPLVIEAWKVSQGTAILMVSIFYVSMFSLNLILVILFGQAVRFGNQARKAMLGLSVLALAGFGAYQLWQGIFV